MAGNTFYKVIIIGDAGVGKTCTIQRFTKGTYSENYVATVGVDFGIKKINIHNKNIKLQIWDTAGQEKFRSIVRFYYRAAHGIVIMYDLTKRESFLHIEHWLKDVRTYADPNIPIVLVGNKCDMEDGCQVDDEDCASLVKKNPRILSSWKISSQENINVSAPFDFLVKHLFDISEDETDVGHLSNNTNRKRKCCF